MAAAGPRRNGGWHRYTLLSPVLITQRQLEVLAWMAEGKDMRQVAKILGITHRTVCFHVYRVMERLDCVAPSQAVAEATRMGLI